MEDVGESVEWKSGYRLQSPKPYPRIGKILELDKLLRIEN
jgi:hypothetical protein